MAAEIRFPFKLEKLVHSLAFFSEQGVPDLTKLKAAKLLYYADRDHLRRYGRPILGDVYFCLQYGPVPSFSLNEMSDAIAGAEVCGEETSDANLFRSVLDVRVPMFSKYAIFKAKQKHDPEVFSDSELEILKEVVDNYGHYSAFKLVGMTHAEEPWKKANMSRDPQGRASIPYDSFFDESDAQQEVLRTVRAEQQESREFDKVFNSIHVVR